MKPTLYLHCGIYKTGSSFLQTMFVRNRELLSRRGIHYPKSEQELEMYKGKITAGNGIHLSDLLAESEAGITELLSADLNESKKMNLNGVLYSSEILFHRFVEKDVVQKMQNAAKAAGYGELRALIYFRDPISHALSTYKHRAKYGDHQDFSYWLEEKYEIFDLLSAFLEYSKSSQIRWTCRRYSPDSHYMLRSSFKDWLQIDTPEIPQEDRVNRSLHLNELRVLQSLKNRYPGSENFLRESFLSLQKEEKESDKSLQDKYSSLIAEKWSNYMALLNLLNTLMKDDEKLIIGSDNKPCENMPYITLSEKQIQAVAEGIESHINSRKLAFRAADIFRRGVNKIRRKWVASRMNYKFPG